MSDVSKTSEELIAELDEAIIDYQRVFPPPYDLAPNLLIARKLADALALATRVPVQGEHGISCDYCGDALPMVESRAHIPTTPDIQRLGFDAEKVVCPECVTRARAVQGEPNEAQVKLAYLAHLKAPRTRGMDVYGPMRAALVAAAGAAPQAESDRALEIAHELAKVHTFTLADGEAIARAALSLAAPVQPSSTVDEAALADKLEHWIFQYNQERITLKTFARAVVEAIGGESR
ncbi:MAG: hypothetical protein ACTIJ6_05435 [Leucobacter sp.]